MLMVSASSSLAGGKKAATRPRSRGVVWTFRSLGGCLVVRPFDRTQLLLLISRVIGYVVVPFL